MAKRKVLHILRSTKRDTYIVNLYNSIDALENTFFFSETRLPKQNSKENIEFLKRQKNTYFYTEDNFPAIKNKSFDTIIVYSLSNIQVKLCFEFLKKETQLVWRSLGGELYTLAFIKLENAYQTETLQFLKRHSFFKNKFRFKFHRFYKRFSLNNKFFKRIDFVSSMLPEELAIINRNKNIRAKYVYLPLGDNNNFKNTAIEKINPDAKNIYIGSSGSAACNHLDVLKKLKDINFQYDIYITLSYKVPSNIYLDKVLEVGYNYFGDRFKPHLTFLSRKEFMTILNTVSTAIFNIDQQEGLYSINICFRKGIKVIMSDISPMYKHLVNAGYDIFSFQKDLSAEMIETPYTPDTTRIKKDNVFTKEDKKAVYELLEELDG